MTTPIASLSIAARATLNMHSLNNEGSEGNQTQTRMVEIVDHKGELHSVNAISGDMLKHIMMEHFYQLARDRQLALCTSCQRFNANRINADDVFLAKTANIKLDSDFINQMLAHCAIDDVAGILVTEGKRSIPRKSISEFGWVIGLPEKTRTESYLHVKYVSERSKEKRAEDAAGQKSGSNLGQSLFHRPASSGIYAIICHLELARIGYNDILQKYAIEDEERHKRCSLLLESLLHTFIELNGAMCSSQLPHLVTLEGVITTSSGVIPAPLVSPLLVSDEDDEQNKAYKQQIEGIVSALNGNGEPTVKMQAFSSISEFANLLRTIIDSSIPFKSAVR